MKCCMHWIALSLIAVATVTWLSGCAKPSTPQAANTDKGKDTGRADGHKDGDHDKPLTEKDVKMPDSFKAGVARLEELHKTIQHHIEHGELAKVPHPAAEEMALVAKKMKELAQSGVAEDKRAEAGRLCNELAGYFKPIDEAADAGKKAEVEAVSKKMGETIGKLKGLAN